MTTKDELAKLRAAAYANVDEQAEAIRAEDAERLAEGFTHRVDARVHPSQGGDDYPVCWYTKGEPTEKWVRGKLRGKRSALTDDFRIVALSTVSPTILDTSTQPCSNPGLGITQTAAGTDSRHHERTKTMSQEETTMPTTTIAPTEKKAKRAAKPAKKAAKKAKPAKATVRKLNGEASRSVIPLEVAKSYQRAKNKDGKLRVDSGDEVALKLRNLDLEAIYALAAKACDLTVKDLKSKYASLNPGMQRMNLGNKIRGATQAKAGK